MERWTGGVSTNVELCKKVLEGAVIGRFEESAERKLWNELN